MALEVISSSSDGTLPLGTLLFAVFVVIASIFIYYAQEERPYPGFKLIGKEPGEWTNAKAKERFVKNAISIMKRGMDECQGKVFQVIGKNGPVIILPPSFTDEIRNNEHLSLTGFGARDFFPSYPGLHVFGEGIQDHHIFQDVVRKNLTQALGGMTAGLSEEATQVIGQLIPAAKDWTPMQFSHVSPMIAAQLSAKVFLGEPICHNREWLAISIRYTVDAFNAARVLRTYAPWARPLVYRFLPELRTVQNHVKQARAIIEPEIAARRAARQEALLRGEKTKSTDAIGWFEDVAAGRPFDFVSGQLLLSVVSIHTTSMTLMTLLYDLTANPQYIDLLREEIVQVLKEDGGWKKTSLYKMKLLDSCMKESQRVHVLGANAMQRRVEKTVTLSDGTRLPKGSFISVPTYQMFDPKYWGPDAEKFDGHRFLNMRNQPGQENRWQFVTTSAEHLGFGHGQHACPGRFFASNEIKIAIAHLLLKYDWKFEGGQPKSLTESEYVPDPSAKIFYKSRECEIEL
ncbi:Cytochrome p450 [Lasiodiplodia theobromae]|uniref:Cytochrome p450 n=1 Tax=Lasiodiplodia theobromae TaxID=45133 RepID=UPI0015C36B93|nr:Cytochrome p450 [Lasiodiplodia theobromae]KAF4535002.1 Cytochrome p450 [Lasiodiplodia theobromae]